MKNLNKTDQTDAVIAGMNQSTPRGGTATTPSIPPQPGPMPGNNGVVNGRKGL